MIDTSVWGAALFSERYSPQAKPVLSAVRSGAVLAVAPDIGLAEFANICRKKMTTTGGTTPVPNAMVDAIMASFVSLPVLWYPVDRDLAQAWSHHRNHGVETWDAFFLVCAQAWDADLVTNDRPFSAAAKPLHGRTYHLVDDAFVP